MMTFSPAETTACCHLIELALREDFGPGPGWPDVTSFAVIPPACGRSERALFLARSPGVIAGIAAAALVAGAVDPQLQFRPQVQDGTAVKRGTELAILEGPIHGILMAERTALNFLQRLSGIATLTRRYVDAVAGLQCEVLDTRKTTPGWRLLEKYAVRCGGGQNHRMGLYDMVLIKDNHLAAVQASCPTSIAEIVRLARRGQGATGAAAAGPVEIEVDTLEQLKEALEAKPDMVLLDNLSLDQLREAVELRNTRASDVLLEASGGVNLQTVQAIAETGVDRISVGALTHSAPALDIALDYVQA